MGKKVGRGLYPAMAAGDDRHQHIIFSKTPAQNSFFLLLLIYKRNWYSCSSLPCAYTKSGRTARSKTLTLLPH